MPKAFSMWPSFDHPYDLNQVPLHCMSQFSFSNIAGLSCYMPMFWRGQIKCVRYPCIREKWVNMGLELNYLSMDKAIGLKVTELLQKTTKQKCLGALWLGQG